MRQVDCASNVGPIRLQITGEAGSIFGASQQKIHYCRFSCGQTGEETEAADEDGNRVIHLPAHVRAEGRHPQADCETVRRGSEAERSRRKHVLSADQGTTGLKIGLHASLLVRAGVPLCSTTYSRAFPSHCRSVRPRS